MYRLLNRERINAYNREYRRKHKEWYRECVRRSQEKHKKMEVADV